MTTESYNFDDFVSAFVMLALMPSLLYGDFSTKCLYGVLSFVGRQGHLDTSKIYNIWYDHKNTRVMCYFAEYRLGPTNLLCEWSEPSGECILYIVYYI